jgi:16S rRNA processing protein RimM
VVVGTHGLNGGLKLKLDNPQSQTLSKIERIFLQQGGALNEYRLLRTGRAGRGFLLQLEGIDTIDNAQLLRGAEVMVAREDLPKLPAGEFYYCEIVGFTVVLEDGRRVGRLEETFSNGAQDVIVVRGGSSELLIPVTENTIRSIDYANRSLTVAAPPGLFE